MWRSHDYKKFRAEDIICEAKKQTGLSLVVKTDEEAIWCVGLVHAAFTADKDIRQPVYPMRFDEIEAGIWGDLMKLGSLDDYKEYIARTEKECVYKDEEGES